MAAAGGDAPLPELDTQTLPRTEKDNEVMSKYRQERQELWVLGRPYVMLLTLLHYLSFVKASQGLLFVFEIALYLNIS